MKRFIFMFLALSVLLCPLTAFAVEETADDFDDGSDPTYIGGATWGGVSTNDAETSTTTYNSAVQHGPAAGNSLRFEWSNIDGGGEWAVLGLVSLDIDISTYNAYSFWIYTPNAGTDIQVVMQSAGGAAYAAKVNLTDYFNTAVNTWQNVSIPMAAFERENALFDSTQVNEIKWESAFDSGNDASGDIYVDDVKFALEPHAPADSLIFSGGLDRGTTGHADVPGDTLIWWDQASGSQTTNATTVKVDSVYAIAYSSIPATDKIAEPNSTVYFPYQIRNDGNTVDEIAISTTNLDGPAWDTKVYWDKNENGAYDAGTDTDSWSSPGTLPASTFYFLIGVDIPSGAADNSSTTIRITAKDNKGSGANDSWPTASNDDTIISTFVLTANVPVNPGDVLISEVYADATNETTSEFVELYNTTNGDINISGWYIQDSTTPGLGIEVTIDGGAIIPAKGYFLIGDAQFNTQSDSATVWGYQIDADELDSMSLNNSDHGIALRADDDTLMDAFAWGTPAAGEPVEGSAFANPTGANVSHERYSLGGTPHKQFGGNEEDTNDNSADFFENSSANVNPQNTSSEVEPDVTEPSAISNLTALAHGSIEGGIVLSWTAPGDNVAVGTATAYEIKASSVGNITTAGYSAADLLSVHSPSNLITPSIAGTAESMTVTGLIRGTTYWFAVKAIDKNNNYSDWSVSGANAASFAISYDTAPAAPASITALAGDKLVTIQWSAVSSDDLASYKLYYDDTDPFDFGDQQLATQTVSTSFLHTGLTNNATYSYRVTAVDGGPLVLESAYSVSDSTIPTGIPANPGDVLISEVYVDAINETTSEWIELYNPGSVAINLEGWMIKKGTYAGAANEVVIDAGAIIQPKSYFLIADAQFNVASDSAAVWGYQIDADELDSMTLTNSDDGISLWSDDSDLVDSLGYGTVAADEPVEGSAAANPGVNESLERYSIGGAPHKQYGGNEEDSDDNSADFFTNSGTAINPQNSSSEVEPDIIGPVAVSNLTALTHASTEGAVTLNWTAPGDNGTSGTATSYEIRISSLADITAAGYASAPLLSAFSSSAVISPSVAGTAETMTVTGLIPGDTYWFAIKAIDKADSTGTWSNVGVNTVNFAIAYDTTPAVPSGLAAQQLSATSIRLTWNANTEIDLLEYELDYSSVSASSDWQDLISTTSLVYDHTGLENDTSYWYRIMSWDKGGLSSAWSAAVGTMTALGSPPAITISKSTSAASGKPGDTITYTLTYGNTGGQTATNVIITDVIPFNTEIENNTVVNIGESVEYYVGSSWQGGFDASATRIRFTRGTLNGGTTNQQVSFDVKIK